MTNQAKVRCGGLMTRIGKDGPDLTNLQQKQGRRYCLSTENTFKKEF
jgi:hypothetical protein